MSIIEQALDDMVQLGLLTRTPKLNRNGNPVFVKTEKAKAMGDDAYAEAFELALARRGLPGSAEASMAPETDVAN